MGLLRAGLEHGYRGDIAAFAQAFINAHYTTADIGDLTNLAVVNYINDMLIPGTLVARRRNGGDCLGNQCYFKCPTVAALQGIIANSR